LFHRHAGERESGRNVRRRQWACLNFNQGDLVRDWSKPREVLLDEFDFPPVSFVFHFLTPCPPRRDLTLRASVTVERGRCPLYLCIGVSWLASFCQRPSRRIQASSARNSPCSG